MLAKGHHLPNVTLVALVNVDSALFSLDFRAEERLAQLYIQVAGRAGRADKQGEVVLQTHYPDHPLLTTLLANGYQAFAKETLQLRHSMGLPPFTFQALFKAQARHSDLAENCLSQIADFFNQSKLRDYKCLAQCLHRSAKSRAISLAVIIAASFKNDVAKALREYQQVELEKTAKCG